MIPHADFIVELTDVLFQDTIYNTIQCKGASFAPEYAFLYLGLWEQEYVFNSSETI